MGKRVDLVFRGSVDRTLDNKNGSDECNDKHDEQMYQPPVPEFLKQEKEYIFPHFPPIAVPSAFMIALKPEGDPYFQAASGIEM
jgi:hypothetical protein